MFPLRSSPGISTQLARGLGVEVVMPGDAVVFGEVRYCRRARDAFRVGIRIEDVVYSRLDQGEHIPENQLLLYLNGSGLKVPEVVRARIISSTARSAGFVSSIFLQPRATNQPELVPVLTLAPGSELALGLRDSGAKASSISSDAPAVTLERPAEGLALDGRPTYRSARPVGSRTGCNCSCTNRQAPCCGVLPGPTPHRSRPDSGRSNRAVDRRGTDRFAPDAR